MRIAIQGEEGSFHHEATARWFGESVPIVPGETFSEVFGSLNRREADAAVVAIENSLYGGINQVYDLLEAHGYPIVGEVHLRIQQQLIGMSKDKDITHIYSHPVAFAQCEGYLDLHFPQAKRIEYHDTAAAVEFVKISGHPEWAAIGSSQAARLHSMDTIRPNIEDNPENYTRFLVVQPDGAVPEGANRTSLVLTTDHSPGVLAKILTVFSNENINLSKLQSRPIPGKAWKYKFYLVLDAAGEQLNSALAQVRPLASSVTILGEYKHDS